MADFVNEIKISSTLNLMITELLNTCCIGINLFFDVDVSLDSYFLP